MSLIRKLLTPCLKFALINITLLAANIVHAEAGQTKHSSALNLRQPEKSKFSQTQLPPKLTMPLLLNHPKRVFPHYVVNHREVKDLNQNEYRYKFLFQKRHIEPPLVLLLSTHQHMEHLGAILELALDIKSGRDLEIALMG
jgi:hypothetical protein